MVDLLCLLARRALFNVQSFVEFVACFQERHGNEMSNQANAVMSSAYNIECGPGRGYKSCDVLAIRQFDRLQLYVWQLPREFTSLSPCHTISRYNEEVYFTRWLRVTRISKESLLTHKTLERAQLLCLHVFHMHGVEDRTDESSNSQRVMKEIEYHGKVGELVSAVKTMCGHDKGRFTTWFLRQIDNEGSFISFSDNATVEHIVRMVLFILEVADTISLLKVLMRLLQQSPVYLVRNVILLSIERHEIAFSASGQIPLLLQAFVNRFNTKLKAADDKAGNVAKFFCKMYYAHAKKKETVKLDLPFALLRPIAETARKNQEMNSQKPKEVSLEVANPLVRIPPARESMPPELKCALSKTFKALQGKTYHEESSVGTPVPDESLTEDLPKSNADKPMPFGAHPNGSTTWTTAVMGTLDESLCQDCVINQAVISINACMTVSSGSTNVNATRERRTPNYVYILRAVMSEVMDKWMANISLRSKTNCKRPVMTPHYIHRCARLLREMMEQHPDGDDFQEKFTNILLVWLQKEVIPGFSGSDSSKRTRNPFINLENSRDAFVLNQKGKLDKVQYGLKVFLVSLIAHKVTDLSQIIRLVLVPLFPRLVRLSVFCLSESRF